MSPIIVELGDAFVREGESNSMFIRPVKETEHMILLLVHLFKNKNISKPILARDQSSSADDC